MNRARAVRTLRRAEHMMTAAAGLMVGPAVWLLLTLALGRGPREEMLLACAAAVVLGGWMAVAALWMDRRGMAALWHAETLPAPGESRYVAMPREVEL